MSSPGLADASKKEIPFQPKIPLSSRGSSEESNPKVAQGEIHRLQEQIEGAKKGSKALKKEQEPNIKKEEVATKKEDEAAWLLNSTARVCQSVSFFLHLHHQHQAL